MKRSKRKHEFLGLDLVPTEKLAEVAEAGAAHLVDLLEAAQLVKNMVPRKHYLPKKEWKIWRDGEVKRLTELLLDGVGPEVPPPDQPNTPGAGSSGDKRPMQAESREPENKKPDEPKQDDPKQDEPKPDEPKPDEGKQGSDDDAGLTASKQKFRAAGGSNRFLRKKKAEKQAKEAEPSEPSQHEEERSKSPPHRKGRERSKSPPRRRGRERSKSPPHKKGRERSKSQPRKKDHKRSKSQPRKKDRKRSPEILVVQ